MLYIRDQPKFDQIKWDVRRSYVSVEARDALQDAVETVDHRKTPP